MERKKKHRGRGDTRILVLVRSLLRGLLFIIRSNHSLAMEELMSPYQLATLSGVGRAVIYKLLQRGIIQGKKIDRKWVINDEYGYRIAPLINVKNIYSRSREYNLPTKTLSP